MERPKRIIIERISMSLLFLIYFISLVYKNTFLNTALSPLLCLFSAYIIFSRFKKTAEYEGHWMLLFFAAATWGLVDLGWGYVSLILKLNPQDIGIFSYLYMLPNLFITISILTYFKKNLKKIERAQLTIDILVIVILMLNFFWSMVFNRSFELKLKNIEELITFIYIAMDFISITTVYILFLSTNKRTKSNREIIIMFGVMIYAMTDLFCVYQIVSDKYISNAIMNSGFVLSFMIFGIAGAYKSVSSEESADKGRVYDISRYNWNNWFVFIPPILLTVIGELDKERTFVFLSIISIWRVFNYYIKSYSDNKYLLELKIKERTKELLYANNQLQRLSRQDEMSKLHNRRYFIEKLETMIFEKKQDEVIAVFFMDLNRFKSINDSYGHDMGDFVLIEVSRRLTLLASDEAILARLGGDEFVIAKLGRLEKSDMETFAKEIIRLCEKPIVIEPYSFNISTSVGIAMSNLYGCDRSTLMKNADIAMYHAKRDLNWKYAFYDQDLSGKMERKNRIELLLKKVCFDQEFSIHYQPQFEINTKKIVGIEALIRWNSPEKGFVSPGEFIPIAEESGIIVPIGKWVMENAIVQVSKWNKDYDMNLRVGINVSPQQMDGISFVEDLRRLLSVNDIAPELVDIEITENIAMDKTGNIKEVLKQLTDLGVMLSIDDFGTGYSSLGYIKRYDIDRLKIAKELVDNISSDEIDLQIIKAIIMMAKAMNIKTIAEGVEEESQLNRLIELGCEEIQGYIWDRPLKTNEFEKKYLKLSKNY